MTSGKPSVNSQRLCHFETFENVATYRFPKRLKQKPDSLGTRENVPDRSALRTMLTMLPIPLSHMLSGGSRTLTCGFVLTIWQGFCLLLLRLLLFFLAMRHLEEAIP